MASVTSPPITGAEPRPAPEGTDARAVEKGTRRALDLDAVYTAAAAFGGWRLGLRQLADNSFLVHLVTGRYILHHGIPHSDIYSYSAPGTHWIAQSWLMESLYGVLDSLMGGFGIRLLIGTLGAILFGGLYRLALHTTRDRNRAALLSLAAFGPVVYLFGERPLTLGLVALLTVVWCIELPASAIGRHPLIVLPIVLWIWGNSHGSVALGFGYLALHVLGRWLDGASPLRPGRERTVLLGALIGAAAMCVNPYGPALLWFPIGLLSKGAALRKVTEWMSPDFHLWGPMLFALWVCIVVAAFARGTRPSRRDLLVALPFLLLSFWALRNIAIAVIVTLPMVGRAVALPATALDAPTGDGGDDDGDEADVRTTNRGSTARVARVAVAAFVALGLVMAVSLAQRPSFTGRNYSVAAYAAYRSQGLVGHRLLTTDANSAYVLLRDWPRQRDFMDDRFDMFPMSLQAEYQDLNSGRPDWRAVLDRHAIDAVIWRAEWPLSSLLASDPQWREAYRDRTWVLFVRR